MTDGHESKVMRHKMNCITTVVKLITPEFSFYIINTSDFYSYYKFKYTETTSKKVAYVLAHKI